MTARQRAAVVWAVALVAYLLGAGLLWWVGGLAAAAATLVIPFGIGMAVLIIYVAGWVDTGKWEPM